VPSHGPSPSPSYFPTTSSATTEAKSVEEPSGPSFTTDGQAELEELTEEHREGLKAAKASERAEKRTASDTVGEQSSSSEEDKAAIQSAAASEAAKGDAAMAAAAAEDQQQELVEEEKTSATDPEQASALWRSSMLGLAGLCALLAGVVVRTAHAAIFGRAAAAASVPRRADDDEEASPVDPLIFKP